MTHTLRSIAFAGFTILSAVAAPQVFDFEDPKGVNAVQFTLDSVLEPIAGTASDVAGKVTFDLANVAATQGKIAVETDSLKTSNSTMTEHLLSAGWVDAEKHPEISFAFTKLDDVKPAGDNRWSATANGDFTLKGVTKSISVPVTLTYLPGAFGKRINKPELPGDLLVVRGAFSIERADYGIKPGQNEDKVSPSIQLTFALVGGPEKK
ncbi:MAG: YceI family protein [Opitutaceae bacterium]|jgi:polyisoprenoid-binding protein YceI|nr:YceI family protein [Opitutaceae bacterium]